jgi:hypothetical protein
MGLSSTTLNTPNVEQICIKIHYHVEQICIKIHYHVEQICIKIHYQAIFWDLNGRS